MVMPVMMSVTALVIMVIVIVAGLSFSRAIDISGFVIVRFQGVAKLCLRSDLRSIPDAEPSPVPELGTFRFAILLLDSSFCSKHVSSGDLSLFQAQSRPVL